MQGILQRGGANPGARVARSQPPRARGPGSDRQGRRLSSAAWIPALTAARSRLDARTLGRGFAFMRAELAVGAKSRELGVEALDEALGLDRRVGRVRDPRPGLLDDQPDLAAHGREGDVAAAHDVARRRGRGPVRPAPARPGRPRRCSRSRRWTSRPSVRRDARRGWRRLDDPADDDPAMDDHRDEAGPRARSRRPCAERRVAAGAELEGQELEHDQEARSGGQDRRQAGHAALIGPPPRPGPFMGPSRRWGRSSGPPSCSYPSSPDVEGDAGSATTAAAGGDRVRGCCGGRARAAGAGRRVGWRRRPRRRLRA